MVGSDRSELRCQEKRVLTDARNLFYFDMVNNVSG